MNISTIPFAQFHGDLEVIAPIVSVALVFSIPLAIIFTKHQQKMAELLRGRNTSRDSELESQVAELRQRLNEQTILLDQMSSQIREIPTRLNVSQGGPPEAPPR